MTRPKPPRATDLDHEGCEIQPPPDMKAMRFEVAGEEFAILEFPLLRNEKLAGLSAAEREVVALLLAGHSVPEVARLRQRSRHTIANQVRCIYAKLGVRSREELVSAASSPPAWATR